MSDNVTEVQLPSIARIERVAGQLSCYLIRTPKVIACGSNVDQSNYCRLIDTSNAGA